MDLIKDICEYSRNVEGIVLSLMRGSDRSSFLFQRCLELNTDIGYSSPKVQVSLKIDQILSALFLHSLFYTVNKETSKKY